MKVVVYGSSDDLIEFEGDISEEFNVGSQARKYYVYSKEQLQFTIQIKYTSSWEVVAKLDKNFDEDENLHCSNWNITLEMTNPKYCRYSQVLYIDSGDDIFEIEKKRRI